MRRYLRYFSVASWVVGIALAVFLYVSRDPTNAMLLRVRDLAFSSYSRDTAELRLSPDAIQTRGFRTDSPASIATLRARLERTALGHQLDSIARIPSSIERAQSLIRVAFAPGPQVGCGSVNDLYAKLDWVQHGGGCCSDYTEVFLALGRLVGVYARQANFAVDHTVASFFAPELGRWVFVDPFLGVMSRDSTGFLSTQEVHSRAKPPLVFFGGPRQVHSPDDKRLDDLNEVLSEDQLLVTWGNNVIEQDRQYGHLARLPKPIAQGIGFITGVRPEYRIFVPHFSATRVFALNARRWFAILLAAIVGVGCAAHPLYALTRLRTAAA